MGEAASQEPLQANEPPPRFKEYVKNFGNDDLEGMIDGFLLNRFPGIDEIIPASVFDDRKVGVDRWIRTEDGVKFVPDYTGTDDPEQMKKKTQRFLDSPLVRVHDKHGNVVEATEVLRLVIPVRKRVWGMAYNEYLKAGSGSPADYLPDANGELLRIAVGAVRQLDQLLISMKEAGKPAALIKRVAAKSIPVREYFVKQIELLKKEPRTA